MPQDFESVRVLLRNPDPLSHRIATATLANQGCRAMVTAQCLGEAETHLKSDMIDLIICDADHDMEEACHTIRTLRGRKDGDNAFALSIMLVSNPDPETVAALVDSGTDAILVKPFQPMALAMQVAGLVRARKPFVITSSYVGPERRSDGMRPGTETAPRVAVPNPLREMTAAPAGRDLLRRKVRATWQVVSDHRVERQALGLGWLSKRLLEALDRRPVASDSGRLLGQMMDAATDLRLAVGGTGYDHVGQLAGTLIDLARDLSHHLDAPEQRKIALLSKVAEALAAAYGRDRAAIAAGRQISDTMARAVPPTPPQAGTRH